MLLFEWRRLLRSKSVRIGISLLIIYAVALCGFNLSHSGFKDARQTDRQINDCLAQYSSEEELADYVTSLEEVVYAPENADRIYTETGRFGKNPVMDLYIANQAAARLQYLQHDYPQQMIDTVEQAIATLQTADIKPYTRLESELAIRQYNRVRTFSLSSAHGMTAWHTQSLGYLYLHIFILLTVILVSVDTFSYENNHGLRAFVFPSSRGRTHLFAVKLLAVLFLTGVITLIVALYDLIIAVYAMGGSALGAPLQSMETYSACPYAITILEFLLLRHLLRYLLICVIIGICAAVCTVIPNHFAALLVSTVPIMTGEALWVIASQYHQNGVMNTARYARYESLRCFLPFALTESCDYFQKFDVISIGGMPVPRLTVCVCVSVIILLGTLVFAALRFGRPSLRRR